MEHNGSSKESGSKGRVLVVDDERELLRGYVRALSAEGFEVDGVSDARLAADRVEGSSFDVVISDISMPGLNGIDLLRSVRAHNLDIPVVLMTASPSVESAAKAVDFGAFRYLIKPVDVKELAQVVQQAVQMYRMAKLKRDALEYFGNLGMQLGDRAGLAVHFDSALASLWMAYQPIVSWSAQRVVAYEALLRTAEPAIPHPGAFLDAAERLHRLDDLGRAVRASVAGSGAAAPDGAQLFVNLHSQDLLDETLFRGDSPLAGLASRVVLEITERASLDDVKDVRARIAALRDLGYRIAVDDLGAGYAGLTSFANLEPEIVKLDMSLVRNVHQEPTKQRLIRSMVSLCREMSIQVVAEGVETVEERDVVVDLGCDLLQGYLFAKPGKPFPQAVI